MSAEIHTEANTHNQINQCNTIQCNAPDWHYANGSNQSADDADYRGNSGQKVGQKQQRDGDNNDASAGDTLEGLAEHCQVLVSVDKVAVKCSHLK